MPQKFDHEYLEYPKKNNRVENVFLFFCKTNVCFLEYVNLTMFNQMKRIRN